MNAEDYQELLDRAMSLMDERDSTVAPASIPGEISVTGRTLSLKGDYTPAAEESEASGLYGGDLVLRGSRVGVIPFGVALTADTEYFMAPNIYGRSVFDANPRTLYRRPNGAAVYLESVFELYDPEITPDDPEITPDDPEITPDDPMSGPPFRSRLVACNIVDRALGDPYPIQKASVSVVAPAGTWTINSTEAKAYRLLGVYTRTGTVYNQTVTSWSSGNTTLPDGRIIPPMRPAATIAPVRVIVSYA